MSATSAVAKVVRLGADMLDGTLPSPSTIARSLVGIALDLVPVEELRGHLNAEAAERIDAEVDLVVEAKLAATKQ